MAEAGEKKMYAGRWTREEELYTDALIEEFRAGNLEGVAEGATLRNFLADAVSCHPKRISKKYEGTEYNGRQQFWRNIQAISGEETTERNDRMDDLRFKFEEARNYSIERAKRMKKKRRLSPAFAPVKAQSNKTQTNKTATATPVVRQEAKPVDPPVVADGSQEAEPPAAIALAPTPSATTAIQALLSRNSGLTTNYPVSPRAQLGGLTVSAPDQMSALLQLATLSTAPAQPSALAQLQMLEVQRQQSLLNMEIQRALALEQLPLTRGILDSVGLLGSLAPGPLVVQSQSDLHRVLAATALSSPGLRQSSNSMNRSVRNSTTGPGMHSIANARIAATRNILGNTLTTKIVGAASTESPKKRQRLG